MVTQSGVPPIHLPCDDDELTSFASAPDARGCLLAGGLDDEPSLRAVAVEGDVPGVQVQQFRKLTSVTPLWRR